MRCIRKQENINDYIHTRPGYSKNTLCHAPSKNILFIQGGKVMACHFNRGYILGKYPSQTVTDIINGNTLKALKNKLKNYHFPDSCFFCKNEIDNNRFYQAGCKKYDYLSEFSRKNKIISMEFQTSNVCNLECIMCSGEYSSMVRKNRERGLPYSNPYDDNFIKQLIPYLNQLKFASFTGGEPFLNPLYYEIWRIIKEANPHLHITVSTNGTVLNDKIRQLYDSLQMELTVSIDTLDKDTYNQIRKNADFDTTMNNIGYFLNESIKKNRIFSIKSVIMKQNIHQIPGLFEFFNEKNVQIYPKLIWAPVDLSLRYAPVDEIDAYISVLRKCKLTSVLSIQKFNCIRYNEIISTLEKWKEEASGISREKLMTCTFENLLFQLRQLLTDFVTHDEMIGYEKRNELLGHIDLLDSFIISLNKSPEDNKLLLSGILSLPAHMIVNEFYRMNPEMFITRLIKN